MKYIHKIDYTSNIYMKYRHKHMYIYIIHTNYTRKCIYIYICVHVFEYIYIYAYTWVSIPWPPPIMGPPSPVVCRGGGVGGGCTTSTFTISTIP